MSISITLSHAQTAAVKYLKVEAVVRYWEDAEVNGVQDKDGSLVPCRDGRFWSPTIDLVTGTIENWPVGITADIQDRKSVV